MRTYPNKFGRLLLRDGCYGLNMHGQTIIRVPGKNAEWVEDARAQQHADETMSITSGSGLILDHGQWRLK